MTSDTPLKDISRLNPIQQKALERLGLKTARDLLYHFPSRYEVPGQRKQISELAAGDDAVIFGKILSAKTSKAWRKKIPLGEAVIEDETGKIKAIWFHQPYLAKKVAVGQFAEFRGKVAARKKTGTGAVATTAPELYLTNPEVRDGLAWQAGKESLFYNNDNNQNLEEFLVPVYPETRGLSSGWFYYQQKKLLAGGALNDLVDSLPTELLKKFNLPSLKTALVWIHHPKKPTDAEAARKRFAFEEVFFIQLARLRDKKIYQSNPSFSLRTSKTEISKFLKNFPFKPTTAQTKAIEQILADFAADKPMVRLLEGDVGSGKTLVAAAATFAIVNAGYEVSYMAPTEILARQHFESFCQYFAHLNVQVGLLTGKECRKFPSKINPTESTHISRTQLLKWVANGEIPILVGTHALIQKNVKFKELALVIIDEQHRFGVLQRAKLARKNLENGSLPHLLTMTATPIPRTLALTVYGDLDLTLLDELPAGRKPIVTKIIPPNKREAAYEHVREELAAGRQAYVICPRIDEPDPEKELAIQAKSARAEAKRLQEKNFPEFEVGLMHGKLKPKDKEETMQEFANGEIDILVSTSVVEVGVNVPNATIIMIEGAERFGLAQLHQLRGRVLRSSHQAYCYIFSDTTNAKSMERLKALVETKSGFDLAEKDLALRGAGTMSGEKQWGISDLGMEALRNLKMVAAARIEAEKIIEDDPDLSLHPDFAEKLKARKQELHFE
ncbi:MAG TPA: ATP-dependent DNA helicase RecG [Candidatus Paceibacterota bacterium]|nr:ATP-dependent DNA helicase RecG [Candidatus Paceibacterota bacterium]HPI24618.1 ATP-dependent DNA helicase RecG [Candidatus Paceibacterota bacterium]HPN89681.1 ATP-dependent DNA helicase RecG [Candidatus Paceibacterota bacterium]